tara:strand:+ start:479 stop:610 length:132 start_codon:yes stop_codon:yes gene_type:complete
MIYKFLNIFIISIFLLMNTISCGKRADLERPEKVDGLEPANIE